MKLIAHFIFVLFISISSLFSQQTSTTKQYEAGLTEEKPQRFGLSVAPLSLINFRSRVRAGLWVNLGLSSLALDFEYGSGTKVLLPNRADQFLGIRPEFRYHMPHSINKNKPNSFAYAGFELPITQSKKNLRGATYRSGARRFDISSGTQERTRISGIIKFGYQYSFFKHLYIDLYTGLGAGFRRIRYIDVTNKRETFEEPDEEWGLSSDDALEGDKIILELALGFRIGYAF